MSRFLIKTKPFIKKTLFLLGILTCFFLIRYYLQKNDSRIDKDRINGHYSSMDLYIKPQNKYHEKYELLINEFLKFKNIEVIAKSRGGILFGKPCEIIGDYFTIPKLDGKYAKTESNLEGIHFPIDATKLYDLREIESKETFSYSNLNYMFRLMKKLDIEWISRDSNFIEFSSYVYPADESLDYYNGYIYCLNDSLPQINKNVFYLLYHLEDNWYYFVRETYKGPLINRSQPETDEDYQYLDNLNKINDK